MSEISKGNSLGKVLGLLEEFSQLHQSSLRAAILSGELPTSLPDVSEAGVARKAAEARDLLAKMAALDGDTLPHEFAHAIRVARFQLKSMSRADDWYWLVFDPNGIGFYGMFAATSYCGGFLLNQVAQAAQRSPVKSLSDGDRLLLMLAETVRMVDQLTDRTEGQARRGIYMPKAQLEQARPLLAGLRGLVASSFSAAGDRAEGWDSSRFAAELAYRVQSHLEPAFDRLAAIFDENYRSKSSDVVGLSQYPGGAALYGELVEHHTTLDLSPEQIHQIGLQRMSELKARMAEIRAGLGFEGDDHTFLASLDVDPRWRAETSDGVAAVFQRYIDRIEPKMAEYFDFREPKPCGAAPLPAALEKSMTFGFYKMPGKDDPRGLYLFNAANLTRKNLCNVAAVNYHELVPGHHMHLTVQMSNAEAHPVQRSAMINAFNEGWAEYSATLAGEMGMYESPIEWFGRLVMDAFTTCRLVVDTGMNAFGWSLDQARNYMRENSFMQEAEIHSEAIRYSCDLPAQSLAYKLGDTEILRLREKMRQRLGDQFDIRDFHRALLHPGALPLCDLEWHIGAVADELETG